MTDDGDGFDVGAVPVDGSHHGVAGMRERAELAGGRLDVSSQAGRGTTVSITVPLAAP